MNYESQLVAARLPNLSRKANIVVNPNRKRSPCWVLSPTGLQFDVGGKYQYRRNNY